MLGAVIAAALTSYAAARAARTAPAARTPAAGPSAMRRWLGILGRVWDEVNRDHVSMMAAGVAFYALLAIFPGMSAAISVYGLLADPVSIERHIAALAGVLPGDALKLISDQAHALAAAPRAKLGTGLILGLLLALWSTMSGTSMLMQTLTIAYEEQDDRSILGFYGLAAALTIGAILFGIVALALVAGFPAVLSRLHLSQSAQQWLSLVRWPILAALFVVGLGLLYRLAPQRRTPRWEFFGPGTLAATALCLLGSAGFSFYVARFGSYGQTYGSLGAVVVLLMWLYLSAYIILAGAELNNEVEATRRRRRDAASDHAVVA